MDTVSRYVPVLDPRFSYRGEDVVRTLEQVCPRIGTPKTIRVDQGSEFVSRDLDLWAYQKGVVLDVSRPGKPTDNSFIELRSVMRMRAIISPIRRRIRSISVRSRACRVDGTASGTRRRSVMRWPRRTC